MNFQESQLVDLFLEDEVYWSHLPGKRFFKSKGLSAHREYSLPSKRRCDIMIKGRSNRFFWIIEAKVTAYPAALIQLMDYRKEVLEMHRDSWIKLCSITLMAQFFHPETLVLAEYLGVQCLHVAPINSQDMRTDEIVFRERDITIAANNKILKALRRGFFTRKRLYGTPPALEVVNG